MPGVATTAITGRRRRERGLISHGLTPTADRQLDSLPRHPHPSHDRPRVPRRSSSEHSRHASPPSTATDPKPNRLRPSRVGRERASGITPVPLLFAPSEHPERERCLPGLRGQEGSRPARAPWRTRRSWSWRNARAGRSGVETAASLGSRYSTRSRRACARSGPAEPDQSHGTLAGRRRGVTHRGGRLRVAGIGVQSCALRVRCPPCPRELVTSASVSDRTSVLAGSRQTLPSRGRTRGTGRIAGPRARRP